MAGAACAPRSRAATDVWNDRVALYSSIAFLALGNYREHFCTWPILTSTLFFYQTIFKLFWNLLLFLLFSKNIEGENSEPDRPGSSTTTNRALNQFFFSHSIRTSNYFSSNSFVKTNERYFDEFKIPIVALVTLTLNGPCTSTLTCAQYIIKACILR